MIEIKKKEECCGCHGCTNICPKECISMEIDNEGFWYPNVDKNKCIDCNLCVRVCPIINTPAIEKIKIQAYACKNRDENVRLKSSSGGIFSLLCKEVIDKEGVVFGAVYDKELNVKHIYSETLAGCEEFRGSKYVQSKIGETYKEAKGFLEQGRIVLFSGTPCQISGLDAYLMKKYDNLILVDIACHGVPSPLVYRQYINRLEKNNNIKIKNINFRDKSTGWKGYSFRVETEKGAITEKGYENIFMKGFIGDIYLRPSCYACKFKKPLTSADLTLADYWGIENNHPQFDDDKGVSLILTNTTKGKDLISSISSYIEYIDTDYSRATRYNQSIIRHVKYNPKREAFFKEFNYENLEEIILKLTRISLGIKVKNKIRGTLGQVKRKIIARK